MQFPQLLLRYWASSPVDSASRGPCYNSCLGWHVQILHTAGDDHRALVSRPMHVVYPCVRAGAWVHRCMCVYSAVCVLRSACVHVRACVCSYMLVMCASVCVRVCICASACARCVRVCVCVCGVAGVRGCACASACACGSLRACMCTGASVHMRVHRCVRAQCCACPCVVVLVSAHFCWFFVCSAQLSSAQLSSAQLS